MDCDLNPSGTIGYSDNSQVKTPKYKFAPLSRHRELKLIR